MRGLIIIGLVILFFLGFLITPIFSDSITEYPIPVRSVINSLTENPIERLFIYGYRYVGQSTDGKYHYKVITWYGLTYANIYIYPDLNGGYIERNFL